MKQITWKFRMFAKRFWHDFIFHSGFCNFDDKSTSGQPIQFYNVSPPTIEANTAIYTLPPLLTPMAFAHNGWSESSESSCDGSLSDGSSTASSGSTTTTTTKSYKFNPLSKPFHPRKRSSTPEITTASNENLSINDSFATFSACIRPPSKYVCILCPKTFSTAIELKQHIANKSKQPFDCVICGTTFTNGYQLTRHYWTHLKNHRRISSFNCRACQKKFRSLNQLHRHYDLCQYKLYIFY